MKKKLLTIWMVLLIAMLAISPVYAGGVKVGFSSGSLIADGDGFGFSSYDLVMLTLDAKGYAHVSCIDPGDNGNVVPGQNPIVAIDSQATGYVTSDKNGKFPVHLEVQPVVSPAEAGCANNNWIVQIDWVDWYWAAITITEVSTGNTLWYKEYACMSTPTTVDCKAIK